MAHIRNQLITRSFFLTKQPNSNMQTWDKFVPTCKPGTNLLTMYFSWIILGLFFSCSCIFLVFFLSCSFFFPDSHSRQTWDLRTYREVCKARTFHTCTDLDISYNGVVASVQGPKTFVGGGGLYLCSLYGSFVGVIRAQIGGGGGKIQTFVLYDGPRSSWGGGGGVFSFFFSPPPPPPYVGVI